MNRAFIFPGQGSQKVGMCIELYQNFLVAARVFDEVDDALSFKLSDIIFNGPDADLTQTYNTQPALMACSIALLKVTEEICGKKINELCSVVAGHSLGQYSALCAVGAISISDCARILRQRGLFMNEASPEGEGAMAAVIGADHAKLNDIINHAAKEGVCEIANDNSKDQIVISGSNTAIERAILLFKESGIKAIRLNVSAPFHSSLMAPAAERMKEVIVNAKFTMPTLPVIDNVSVEITSDVDFIKQRLIEQISGTIRWSETMDIIASDYSSVYEMGPGKVLTNLFNRSYPNFLAKAVNSAEDINQLLM